MNQPKVLIVDDDEHVLKLIRLELARAGVPSDGAVTAAEGLAKMKQNLYPVIVSDIHMPGTSGVELLSALKHQSPLAQVIMLTADNTLEQVIDCMDRGAVDFFAKSDPLHLLVAAVGRALGCAARWATWLASGDPAPTSLAEITSA
jgi:DNA-binding NtrC family response regulator